MEPTREPLLPSHNVQPTTIVPTGRLWNLGRCEDRNVHGHTCYLAEPLNTVCAGFTVNPAHLLSPEDTMLKALLGLFAALAIIAYLWSVAMWDYVIVPLQTALGA